MFLEPLALSSSGRAVLFDGEIERLIIDNVSLKFYDGLGGLEAAPAQKYENGSLTLSSHRLLWIDGTQAPNPGRSCYIPLSALGQWDTVNSVAARLNLRKNKIKLKIASNLGHKPAEDGVDGVRFEEVAIIFGSSTPANFQEQLLSAQREKRWQTTMKPKSSLADPSTVDALEGCDPASLQSLLDMGFERNVAIRALKEKGNTSLADAADWALAFQHQPTTEQQIEDSEDRRKMFKTGLGDIFKREQEKKERRDQALGDAFQDLDSLMRMAEEMVKLAGEFYSSFTRSDGEQQSDLEKDTIDELISMGITSPVTKESAGSLYLDQLCRQLADFLASHLAKNGGIMTLPTVYCIFNRARGAAELVSPDDLLTAARLFEKLRIPLKLRTFESGVRVIQSADHDEDAVCRRLAEMVATDNPNALSRPLFAADVVAELNVPLTIAQEHLLLAERNGVLCRDDGPEGLRFHNNFFMQL